MMESSGNLFSAHTIESLVKGLGEGEAAGPAVVGKAFTRFEDLFNHEYGSITKNHSGVEVHLGGYSENEKLMADFKTSLWYQNYFEVYSAGGHYYFRKPHIESAWIVIGVYPVLDFKESSPSINPDLVNEYIQGLDDDMQLMAKLQNTISDYYFNSSVSGDAVVRILKFLTEKYNEDL